MAGQKDKTMVAVIGGLTSTQAENLVQQIMRVKRKYAPKGQGTICFGSKMEVGNLLQRGHKLIEGDK